MDVLPPDLTDPFHRQLFTRLSENIAERMENLANGSAMRITEETQTVAEKYAAQVSYIKALKDVLAVCRELEQDRYGVREPGAGED